MLGYDRIPERWRAGIPALSSRVAPPYAAAYQSTARK